MLSVVIDTNILLQSFSPTSPYSSIFNRFLLVNNDPDDNKFVDVAICGNADFLITLDNHFEDAKKSKFPKVNIISPEEFISKYL